MAEVEVGVRDGAGSPVLGARLVATLRGGRVVGVDELGAGRYRLRLVAPRDPGRGAPLHVEVAGVEPGAPRRVTLHPVAAPPHRIAAEAWIDDDLGQPVPRATVELRVGDETRRDETDRFGVARFEWPRPAAKRFVALAEPLALPGVQAALEYLTDGATLRTVASTVGEGVAEAQPEPLLAATDAELPIRPAMPIDLKLTVPPLVTGALRPLLVQLQITPTEGKAASVTSAQPRRLLLSATSGQFELLRLKAGGADLRFTPPAGTKFGDRFLLAVTDAESGISVFSEVVAR